MRATHERTFAQDSEVQKLNDDLSRLLRGAVFPTAISPFPKKSVSQEVASECRPHDPEFRVDKTHMPVKYDMKTFMEAEFGRRLLAKKMAANLSV